LGVGGACGLGGCQGEGQEKVTGSHLVISVLRDLRQCTTDQVGRSLLRRTTVRAWRE
jgi:hypothetical protein